MGDWQSYSQKKNDSGKVKPLLNTIAGWYECGQGLRGGRRSREIVWPKLTATATIVVAEIAIAPNR